MEPASSQAGLQPPQPGLSMKRFREFFGNTLLAGIIFILPVYLCLLLLLKAMHSLSGLVRPLAILLPPWLPAEKMFSLLVILTLCFILGLLLRTPFGSATRQSIENRLLRKIPGYQLFRALLEQMAGESQQQTWKPALAEIEAALVPAFIIERIEDGSCTVFVPSAPTPFTGSIYILAGNRVHPLNIPLTQAIKALSQWGSGYKAFIASMSGEKSAIPENEQHGPKSGVRATNAH